MRDRLRDLPRAVELGRDLRRFLRFRVQERLQEVRRSLHCQQRLLHDRRVRQRQIVRQRRVRVQLGDQGLQRRLHPGRGLLRERRLSGERDLQRFERLRLQQQLQGLRRPLHPVHQLLHVERVHESSGDDVRQLEQRAQLLVERHVQRQQLLVHVDRHGLQHAAFDHVRERHDAADVLVERNLCGCGRVLVREHGYGLQHPARAELLQLHHAPHAVRQRDVRRRGRL